MYDKVKVRVGIVLRKTFLWSGYRKQYNFFRPELDINISDLGLPTVQYVPCMIKLAHFVSRVHTQTDNIQCTVGACLCCPAQLTCL